MGFFDKLFGGKSKDENTAKFTNQSKTVLTPLQGKVLAQADIPDETFAQGILGVPRLRHRAHRRHRVRPPFDGTVTQIATTLHAVGITSNDGIELLIHVGMDTVDMKGQGFTVLVKENQKVTAGSPAAEGGSGRHPRRRPPHRHCHHRDRWCERRSEDAGRGRCRSRHPAVQGLIFLAS